MRSHCVQTCPRFPSDLKQEGKEPPSPECWQTSPAGGRVGSHHRVQRHVPRALKTEKEPLSARQKRLTAGTGCPGGDEEQRARTPHTQGRARPWDRTPREGCPKPYGPGSAFKSCVRERGSGLNPTCARRQADTH